MVFTVLKLAAQRGPSSTTRGASRAARLDHDSGHGPTDSGACASGQPPFSGSAVANARIHAAWTRSTGMPSLGDRAGAAVGAEQRRVVAVDDARGGRVLRLRASGEARRIVCLDGLATRVSRHSATISRGVESTRHVHAASPPSVQWPASCVEYQLPPILIARFTLQNSQASEPVGGLWPSSRVATSTCPTGAPHGFCLKIEDPQLQL